jgi:hypothetical protein
VVESARRQDRVDPNFDRQAARVGNILSCAPRKNEPSSDFSDKEIEAAKIVAKGMRAAGLDKLNLMKADGFLKEICDGKEEARSQ